MDRLDELNIGHTGIRRRPNGPYSTVVFRDPDNNQLEFAAPALPDAASQATAQKAACLQAEVTIRPREDRPRAGGHTRRIESVQPALRPAQVGGDGGQRDAGMGGPGGNDGQG